MITPETIYKIEASSFRSKGIFLELQKRFTHDVETYEGKGQGERWASNVQNCDELTMSEKIVVEMLDRNALLDQGFTLTVDNWFGSLRLAKFLLQRYTKCWRVAPAGTRRVRESTYYCFGCPQSPVLHIDCFLAWHS